MCDNNILPKNLDSITSETLANIIIANRSIGIYKDESRIAMIELSRREVAGDPFNYQEYIKNGLANIPKVENNELMSMISFFAKMGNK